MTTFAGILIPSSFAQVPQLPAPLPASSGSGTVPLRANASAPVADVPAGLGQTIPEDNAAPGFAEIVAGLLLSKTYADTSAKAKLDPEQPVDAAGQSVVQFGSATQSESIENLQLCDLHCKALASSTHDALTVAADPESASLNGQFAIDRKSTAQFPSQQLAGDADTTSILLSQSIGTALLQSQVNEGRDSQIGDGQSLGRPGTKSADQLPTSKDEANSNTSASIAVATPSIGIAITPNANQPKTTPSEPKGVAELPSVVTPSTEHAAGNQHAPKADPATESIPDQSIEGNAEQIINDDAGQASGESAGRSSENKVAVSLGLETAQRAESNAGHPIVSRSKKTSESLVKLRTGREHTEPTEHNAEQPKGDNAELLFDFSTTSATHQNSGLHPSAVQSNSHVSVDSPPTAVLKGLLNSNSSKGNLTPADAQSADLKVPTAGVPATASNADSPNSIESPHPASSVDGLTLGDDSHNLNKNLEATASTLGRETEEKRTAFEDARHLEQASDDPHRMKPLSQKTHPASAAGFTGQVGKAAGQVPPSPPNLHGSTPESDMAWSLVGHSNSANQLSHSQTPPQSQTDFAPTAQVFQHGAPAKSVQSGDAGLDAQPMAENLARDIVEQARVVSGPAETRIEIELDPPELGRVSVRLSESGDGISARIVVAHQHVWKSVSQSLADFQATLAESGIKLHDFSLAQRQGDSPQRSDGWASTAQQPDKGPPSETAAYATPQTTRSGPTQLVDIHA